MRPLGLSQQDYEELEFPRAPRKEKVHPPVFTWWESALFLGLCALFTVLFLFLCVTAQLCRIGNRR